ncbi:MAG: hypothetical protein LKJ25_08665 [Clostridia bacterium]|jgi:intracellular sulfur oxidation DsrE/DsrF family protein|nr:hypothetical protein [Clostridia bacterium]
MKNKEELEQITNLLVKMPPEVKTKIIYIMQGVELMRQAEEKEREAKAE